MNTKSINDKIKQFPILNDVRIALDLKNLADKTIINYMDGIARFLDFINYDNLFDINEDHFRDYLLYLHSTPLSKNTINANNAYIRFFFFAVLNKNLNLYRVPKSKFTPKDIDFLFDHQIRSLLNAVYIDSRMDCIIKLALCCGLRINEIISLKISDISTRNRSNMSIYIRKSKRNKSRYVPIDNTSYSAIQRYAKEYNINPGSNRYFFIFSRAPKTCNETIRKHFNFYKDIAGIPASFTFHCLRHTYAVNFLRAGGDLLDLKYRLGHSSLASTSRYLHFSRNMMNNHISYIDTLLKDGAAHEN
ncbi:tyrosine-type recombinase/integrase [Thomasclavelia saccharogumia]|jgi:integrase/recombinase XerD|uniref:tyrosine-type recombinase/integrase n=4 Tax=Thomasclavelia saccharogumia TaxID=341225 RepID=UPI000A07AE57|nr:tyrosine-type recombinase/integrase [Thomasclavelia saccharogumia]